VQVTEADVEAYYRDAREFAGGAVKLSAIS
jgi:hypothetical protein